MELMSTLRQSYKIRKMREGVAHAFWSALAPGRRLLLPLTVSRQPVVNVHFGCGTVDDPRFINVDARAMAHVDLVTTSPALRPFKPGSVDLFYACHVFEHLSFHTQQTVLRRWREILKPGGKILLSVPDFDKLVDKYLLAERNPLSIQPALMGGQDYPGNFHFAIFTRSHLAALLRQAGFVDVDDWHPRQQIDWPRDHSWTDAVSLNLTARKP